MNLTKKVFLNGVLHNESGPAVIGYYSDDKIKKEEYRVKGKIHNLTGPAVICYYEDGKVKSQEWLSKGIFHRESGPSLIIYSDTGDIIYESWFVNGQRHRESGPAIVEHDRGYRFEFWYQEDILDKLVVYREKVIVFCDDRKTRVTIR